MKKTDIDAGKCSAALKGASYCKSKVEK
jgi:hypothetical protein